MNVEITINDIVERIGRLTERLEKLEAKEALRERIKKARDAKLTKSK